MIRASTPRWRRAVLLVSIAAAVAAIAIGAALLLQGRGTGSTADAPGTGPAPLAATFVGSDTCRGCHAAEFGAWAPSQHARAMQPATEATVLGDFADARYTHGAITSTFFRRDGRYFVRTDGADGELADFEVKYTFGVEPLQQYLIELPRGHVQALSIAWDSRPGEQGGQRWFHLYSHERITHDDELHWTRRAQNWNFMCADCHSTDLRKHYDAATDSYATTWSEMHVGCEACHGPGSQHVAAGGQRRLGAQLDERSGVTWVQTVAGQPQRSVPRESTREIEVCAQCHARRAQIAEGYRAGERFLDHYLPALLTEPLYWPDGRQRDEVYTYGSFLQSRMHAAGVTCSDCHDPHTERLRVDGNGLCGQCHVAARYDTPDHHRHEAGGAGSACVDCHMPATTYMVVDPRRDHSLRLPGPPACATCHADRGTEWSASALSRWFPERASRVAAHTSRSAEEVARDSASSDVVRATALANLATQAPTAAIANLAWEASSATGDLQRLAAAELAAGLPDADRLLVLAPLLADARRAVRIEAAGAIADLAPAQLPAGRASAWASASREYVDAQRYGADRPEARVNLASFLARQGEGASAQAQFESALRLDPAFVPAYVNGADALRGAGDDAAALALLERGIAAVPGDHAAALHHARGLTLVRLQRLPDAVADLRRAHELAPRQARYAYVYAVGLNSTGSAREAIAVLERSLRSAPDDVELLTALATIARDAGDMQRARRAARSLARLMPGNRDVEALRAELGEK